ASAESSRNSGCSISSARLPSFDHDESRNTARSRGNSVSTAVWISTTDTSDDRASTGLPPPASSYVVQQTRALAHPAQAFLTLLRQMMGDIGVGEPHILSIHTDRYTTSRLSTLIGMYTATRDGPAKCP